MVLPLQKLIHLHSGSGSDSASSDSDDEKRTASQRKRRKRDFWSSWKKSKVQSKKGEPPKPLDAPADLHNPTDGFLTAHASPSTKSGVTQVRTLQRYHGGPNEERIVFMEKHSALASKQLGVSVEQVSSTYIISIITFAHPDKIYIYMDSSDQVDLPCTLRFWSL